MLSKEAGTQQGKAPEMRAAKSAHQEKERDEETKTGKRKVREDRQSILKKLCAALLLSFKRQHCEKMVCAKGVPGVTGTLGKANSHFNPTQTGSGTAPPCLGGC